MTTTTSTSVLGPPRARAAAFVLLARSLGPDPTCLLDPDHVDALRRAVGAVGTTRATVLVERFATSDLPPAEVLHGRWVRWFDHGRVAPYEGSNVVVSSGGVTPRLADVAGYYRAFGLKVDRERPDHVVAELEFVGFALAVEADAIERGDDEHAEVISDAIRTFLRDHVGMWIDAWAARVDAIDDLEPWAPLAAAAATLVHAESSHRNVVPARTDAVLPADAGPADDDEPLLDCE